MSIIYDNWERLVQATLKREQFYQLCHAHSRTPSITSLSSDFTFPSPASIASAFELSPSVLPIRVTRDLLQADAQSTQSHSTIGMKYIRKNDLLMSPNPKNDERLPKRFNRYRFNFSFSLKALKHRYSSQSSRKKPELRKRYLFHSRLSKPTQSRSALLNNDKKDNTPIHSRDLAKNGNKAEPTKELNRGSLNSTSPSKTQHRKSFFDSGDIFPDPKQSVSVYDEVENRSKIMEGEPSKDLETLREILEDLQLNFKGLLHSRKSTEKNQVCYRDFTRHESPVNFTRPLRASISSSTPIICRIRNYYPPSNSRKQFHGVPWNYQIAGKKSQSVTPLREWNIRRPSSNASARQLNEERVPSEDCDLVYIFNILSESHSSLDDSVFRLLEKKHYQDTTRESYQEAARRVSKLQRKLIFHTIKEILHRNTKLPRWKAFSSWMTNYDISKPSFYEVLSEFLRLRDPESADDLFQVTVWGDCTADMSEAILEIQRMIFTELMGEVIVDFATLSSRSSLSSMIPLDSFYESNSKPKPKLESTSKSARATSNLGIISRSQNRLYETTRRNRLKMRRIHESLKDLKNRRSFRTQRAPSF